MESSAHTTENLPELFKSVCHVLSVSILRGCGRWGEHGNDARAPWNDSTKQILVGELMVHQTSCRVAFLCWCRQACWDLPLPDYTRRLQSLRHALHWAIWRELPRLLREIAVQQFYQFFYCRSGWWKATVPRIARNLPLWICQKANRENTPTWKKVMSIMNVWWGHSSILETENTGVCSAWQNTAWSATKSTGMQKIE